MFNGASLRTPFLFDRSLPEPRLRGPNRDGRWQAGMCGLVGVTIAADGEGEPHNSGRFAATVRGSDVAVIPGVMRLACGSRDSILRGEGWMETLWPSIPAKSGKGRPRDCGEARFMAGRVRRTSRGGVAQRIRNSDEFQCGCAFQKRRRLGPRPKKGEFCSCPLFYGVSLRW